MTKQSRINAVVIGLLPFICDRLNRKEIDSQEKLITELNLLESLVNCDKSRSTKTNTIFKQNLSNKKQCLCLKKQASLGEACRGRTVGTTQRIKKKKKHQKYKRKKTNLNNIKIANNTELEKTLND